MSVFHHALNFGPRLGLGLATVVLGRPPLALGGASGRDVLVWRIRARAHVVVVAQLVGVTR